MRIEEIDSAEGGESKNTIFVSKMVAMTGTRTTDFLIAGQVCYALHYHGPRLPRQISTYILQISRVRFSPLEDCSFY